MKKFTIQLDEHEVKQAVAAWLNNQYNLALEDDGITFHSSDFGATCTYIVG